MDEQALNQAALEQRPDLEAARRRKVAAEADRELARAQKKGNVTLGVQYEHNMQKTPNNR